MWSSLMKRVRSHSEEAIPSLFRADQTIVVGDEMQLPPTSFFSTKRDDDDEGLSFEEAGEVIEYDLNSSSFLNHSAPELADTHAGVALQKPLGVADQFFKSCILRRQVADGP